MDSFAHVMVPLSDEVVMMIGPNGDNNGDTHIFNADYANWTIGPRMKSYKSAAQAGRVTYPNGTQVVIVAGTGVMMKKS